MASSPTAAEHLVDQITVSPDQFTDCAQAIIHTILFQRSIDVQVTPTSIRLPGVDIAFASAESPESTTQILSRLAPLQDAVFGGRRDCWIILSLSYNVPKRGWFRDSFANEVWERWCIPFAFEMLTAHQIREAMLHTITQITFKANETEIPRLPEGGAFRYTINLPTDKDWETKDILKLVKRICSTPAQMFE
jgi:hypothetical protein